MGEEKTDSLKQNLTKPTKIFMAHVTAYFNHTVTFVQKILK